MRFFHRHRWKIVSAACDGQIHSIDPGVYQPLVHSFLTFVVSRCECGEMRTKKLIGRHSIEDLCGESSEIDRVLKDLEK